MAEEEESEELLSRSESDNICEQFDSEKVFFFNSVSGFQCETAHDCDVYVSGSKYKLPFNGKIIALRFLSRLTLSVVANPGIKHKSSAKLICHFSWVNKDQAGGRQVIMLPATMKACVYVWVCVWYVSVLHRPWSLLKVRSQLMEDAVKSF